MRGRDAATGYNPSVHVTQVTGKFQMFQKWDFQDLSAGPGTRAWSADTANGPGTCEWPGDAWVPASPGHFDLLGRSTAAQSPRAARLRVGPANSWSGLAAAARDRGQVPAAGPAVRAWEWGSAVRGGTGPAAWDRDRAPAGTALARGLAGWSCFPLEGSCGFLLLTRVQHTPGTGAGTGPRRA